MWNRHIQNMTHDWCETHDFYMSSRKHPTFSFTNQADLLVSLHTFHTSFCYKIVMKYELITQIATYFFSYMWCLENMLLGKAVRSTATWGLTQCWRLLFETSDSTCPQICQITRSQGVFREVYRVLCNACVHVCVLAESGSNRLTIDFSSVEGFRQWFKENGG